MQGASPPRYWKANAPARITALARSRRAALVRDERRSSDDITNDHEAADEAHEERRRDQGQPPLDEVADRRAERLEERRHQEEASAAGDDRGGHEDPEVERGRTARDRDELVGDRRQALDEDDPQSVLRVGAAELLEPGLQAVEIDELEADRREE